MNTEQKFHVGQKVDRLNPSYRFPGTILALYTATNGSEYAVVEMDEYRLQHIFKIDQLKPRP